MDNTHLTATVTAVQG